MRLGSAHRGSIAPGLVLPYPDLEKHGLRLRRGQTSLTVAAPGVGKSQFWMNMTQRMRVPTLYWSADTDQADVTIRTLALHLGETTALVEERLHDDTWRTWMFDTLGSKADHVEWVFDSPITGKHLIERLKAFATVHGEYPSMTVLDNMSNAIQNPADEYSEIKMVQAQAQVIAREFNTHVAILHHAKGQYDGGTTPIPQSGGLQNPFKIPEVGLTLCRSDEDSWMHAFVVKNRGGKSDPAAKYPIRFPIDFSRATVSGYRTLEVAA